MKCLSVVNIRLNFDIFSIHNPVEMIFLVSFYLKSMHLLNRKKKDGKQTNSTDLYAYQSGSWNWYKYAMVKTTCRKVFHFISFVSIKSNGNLRYLILRGDMHAYGEWERKVLANCCLLLLSTISVNGNTNGSFGRKIDLCEHNWHSNWPIMGITTAAKA